MHLKYVPICAVCGWNILEEDVRETRDGQEYCPNCWDIFVEECSECGWDFGRDDLEFNFKQELVCWRCNE